MWSGGVAVTSQGLLRPGKRSIPMGDEGMRVAASMDEIWRAALEDRPKAIRAHTLPRMAILWAFQMAVTPFGASVPDVVLRSLRWGGEVCSLCGQPVGHRDTSCAGCDAELL